MRISKEEEKFKPVTVVLETERELVEFYLRYNASDTSISRGQNKSPLVEASVAEYLGRQLRPLGWWDNIKKNVPDSLINKHLPNF